MGLILDGTTGISASGNIYGATVIVTNTFQPASLSTSGNVQGAVFIATQVTATGNISGANVTTGIISATGGITTTNGITATGNITGGNLSVTNNALVTGNLVVAGSINITGNVTSITGNAAQFFGNAITGYGALYAGLSSGYSVLPSTPFQIATNANTYSQLNQQNINAGSQASSDYVVTANNGTDSAYYGDFGIGSSTYAYPTTTAIGPNDIYLLGVGANPQGPYTGTSNVVISSSNGLIKLLSGGANTSNVIATVDNTGINVTGKISASGNITGGNITTTGSASIAGFTISANTITSQGPTLTLDPNASGGIDGNVVIQGNLVVNGNMTYINSNNITTNDLAINMANNAATATAANGGGIGVGPAGSEYISLTYASGANIWVASNGLSVQGVVQTAGNTTTGNLLTGGLISSTGTVTASQFNGSGAGISSIPGANVTGTLSVPTTSYAATVSTAAQPNITSVGTLSSLAVTGTASAGTFSGSGSGLSSIPGANVTGTLSVPTTSYAATVSSAAQPNITSVGSSLTTSGTLTVNSSNQATAISNGGTNGGGNIGASGAAFNTVYAKATTALYADLAEKYTADAAYAPGTVLAFGGEQEVTKSTINGDRRVAGVVSTDPGFIMNEGLDTEFAVTIALTGRVPTKVTGTVRKGDLMVSNGDGSARAEDNPQAGSIIGKALENFDGETGTIEVVVGRL